MNKSDSNFYTGLCIKENAIGIYHGIKEYRLASYISEHPMKKFRNENYNNAILETTKIINAFTKASIEAKSLHEIISNNHLNEKIDMNKIVQYDNNKRDNSIPWFINLF